MNTAEQKPPPECQTEAEKTAFAFGWWKAMETKREWVGLTRKEVHDIYDSDYVVFHQRIEAKLKEKNT